MYVVGAHPVRVLAGSGGTIFKGMEGMEQNMGKLWVNIGNWQTGTEMGMGSLWKGKSKKGFWPGRVPRWDIKMGKEGNKPSA